MKTFLKVHTIVIIFLIVICVNADSTKAIKSEQYVALTGGTNGFGAKYSYCIGPLSMDFGLPFLYLFGDTKKNDTLDTKDLIKINPYLSANLIFFKKERATVSVGVAWVAEGKIDRGGKKIDNAWIEKNASDNFFTFDYWLGPIFEYNQRGKNNYKLFGMQMLPVKFHLDGRKSYISDIGVQLNFYLRKIEHLPKEDD